MENQIQFYPISKFDFFVIGSSLAVTQKIFVIMFMTMSHDFYLTLSTSFTFFAMFILLRCRGGREDLTERGTGAETGASQRGD